MSNPNTAPTPTPETPERGGLSRAADAALSGLRLMLEGRRIAKRTELEERLATRKNSAQYSLGHNVGGIEVFPDIAQSVLDDHLGDGSSGADLSVANDILQHTRHGVDSATLRPDSSNRLSEAAVIQPRRPRTHKELKDLHEFEKDLEHSQRAAIIKGEVRSSHPKFDALEAGDEELLAGLSRAEVRQLRREARYAGKMTHKAEEHFRSVVEAARGEDKKSAKLARKIEKLDDKLGDTDAISETTSGIADRVINEPAGPTRFQKLDKSRADQSDRINGITSDIDDQLLEARSLEIPSVISELAREKSLSAADLANETTMKNLEELALRRIAVRYAQGRIQKTDNAAIRMAAITGFEKAYQAYKERLNPSTQHGQESTEPTIDPTLDRKQAAERELHRFEKAIEFIESASTKATEVAELAINKGHINLSTVQRMLSDRRHDATPAEAAVLIKYLQDHQIIVPGDRPASWKANMTKEEFDLLIQDMIESTADSTTDVREHESSNNAPEKTITPRQLYIEAEKIVRLRVSEDKSDTKMAEKYRNARTLVWDEVIEMVPKDQREKLLEQFEEFRQEDAKKRAAKQSDPKTSSEQKGGERISRTSRREVTQQEKEAGESLDKLRNIIND